MNHWVYLEFVLVCFCACTSVLCFLRIIFLRIKLVPLRSNFQGRLWLVDPEAYKTIYPMLGFRRVWSINPFKDYIVAKGVNADAELVELEKKINAPVKYGLLTALWIPGGFFTAVVIMFIFDAFLKNLNQH